MQRTQIYLPDDLRKEIDRYLASSGESLAQYLRGAAEARLRKEKREKTDLKKLADQLGSLESTRTRKEADQWIKEIREDRRLSDERLDIRWAGVRKLAKK